MDAGRSAAASSSSSSKKISPFTLFGPLSGGFKPYMQSTSTTSSSSSSKQRPCGGDRFIPVRSAMDMGTAHYLLRESRKGNKDASNTSRSSQAYRKCLAEIVFKDRTSILAFKPRAPEPADNFSQEADLASSHHVKPVAQQRYIPESSERTLDASNIVDDYHLNLLDWGANNVLSIALSDTVYLWDATKGSASELVTVSEDFGPVTSISWSPDGTRIAVGLNSSHIQIWDSSSNRLLRTLRTVHNGYGVGSLSWNGGILTSGGMDGMIVNTDVRIRSHILHTYQGHQHEVCGLKWSGSGRHLASGGTDNKLLIWDISMASSSPSPGQNQWLHRLDDHRDSVKALAWCPWQEDLLASGGGEGCIKFWNIQTGARLNSVVTGSQVSSLLWSKHNREMLSSHASDKNQLTLWKYPSMIKIKELTGHTDSVLYAAQSPDGCSVASAGADATLRIWNVFGISMSSKPAHKAAISRPFSTMSYIR